MIDSNEVTGYISHVTNVDLLRHLHGHITERLTQLGATIARPRPDKPRATPAPKAPVVEPTVSQVSEPAVKSEPQLAKEFFEAVDKLAGKTPEPEPVEPKLDVPPPTVEEAESKTVDAPAPVVEVEPAKAIVLPSVPVTEIQSLKADEWPMNGTASALPVELFAASGLKSDDAPEVSGADD